MYRYTLSSLVQRIPLDTLYSRHSVSWSSIYRPSSLSGGESAAKGEDADSSGGAGGAWANVSGFTGGSGGEVCGSSGSAVASGYWAVNVRAGSWEKVIVFCERAGSGLGNTGSAGRAAGFSKAARGRSSSPLAEASSAFLGPWTKGSRNAASTKAASTTSLVDGSVSVSSVLLKYRFGRVQTIGLVLACRRLLSFGPP